jgi:hypothetical protein
MSIYDDFFNLEGPCPESIEDCEKLRVDYQAELNQLTYDNNCNGCQAINLKAEYQAKVWKAYMNSLIIRA